MQLLVCLFATLFATSAGSSFAQDTAPDLVLDTPAHASRVRGPDVEVKWSMGSRHAGESLSIELDGKLASRPASGDRTFTLRGVKDGVHTVTLGAAIGSVLLRRASTFYVYRLTQQSRSKLYILDLASLRRVNPDDPKEGARAADMLHQVDVLQGLVNRDRARLYINSTNVDQFWLDKMRERGGFLERVELQPLKDVDEALRVFSSYYKGKLPDSDRDSTGGPVMANASVFRLCKLPDRLVQNPPPTYDQLQAKGYILPDGKVAPLNFVYHYLGDYDSAGTIYNRMPDIWRNPARGQIPSGWALSPSLIEQIPVAFDWLYETKSPSDYFIASASDAESGEGPWVSRCFHHYRQLNYSITGFPVNGSSHELTSASTRTYCEFSGDGIMADPSKMPKDHSEGYLLAVEVEGPPKRAPAGSRVDGTVVAAMRQDIPPRVDAAVEAILKHGKPNETAFLAFRSRLAEPDWIKTVNEKIRAARPDCHFESVDPYTYFYLLRHYLGGKNEKRATYTFDTVPDVVKAGQTIKVTAGLRNDGWETWKRAGAEAVTLTVGFIGGESSFGLPLPADVRPGEGCVVSFDLKAPDNPGMFVLAFELCRGEEDWFGDANDMAWEKEVTVR